MLEIVNTWDTQLLLFLNSIHSPFFDWLMPIITATKTWIPLYVLVLYVIIKKEKWNALYAILFAVLVIVLADQISVKLFKNVFERFRPSHEPAIRDIIHIVNDYRGGRYGFVSSHAANTFGFATYMALYFSKKWVSLSLFSWALIVSYSRIYLGVHYPGDILGGALLGMLIGSTTFWLMGFSKEKIISKMQQIKSA